MSLSVLNPWGGCGQASAQAPPFFVVRISPRNGATNVSTNTNVVATFSLPLIAETVNDQTFQVLQANGEPVAGLAIAVGPVATFSPLESLPANTSFVVRIVGGSMGVMGGSLLGASVPLPQDFTSRFTTGGETPGDGTPVPPDTGGTVTDPRTGASIEIPPFTLKTQAQVKVITLDSPAQIGQIDNSCGVPIQPGEDFPDVPGFVRATEVTRYEVQPCDTNAFGPGSGIKLRLRRDLFPRGLRIKRTPPLLLFELTRSNEGRLTFSNTGIIARVTGPGSSRSRGDFVISPDIQVFGTFAAFLPAGALNQAPQGWSGSTDWIDLPAVAQPVGGRLYFPLINQLGGRQTRISIGNPGVSALNITLTAYTEDGMSTVTPPQTVTVNRQASYDGSTLVPGFAKGAIVVQEESGGAMTGFCEIADSFQTPTMLASAEGIQTPQSALIFPVVKSNPSAGRFTEIHVFNPNDSPVNIKLAGFTNLGSRVDPTNSMGQPLGMITIPQFGTLVISSAGASSTYDVQLDFTSLDGGYVIVQTTDGQAVTGSEIFGEVIDGQSTFAVLNGLPFPAGCLASMTDPCACHVDTSPESPVPSAIRQYTLYATHFESTADPILYLVNVSDSPANIAISAFSEQGQFLKTFPPTGFLTIDPHQVFQVPVKDMDRLGFNPGAGYVRVEDPSSSFVGAIINRDMTSGKYLTAAPLVPDDPQLTQTPTSTFFSRIRLDPASANPRLTTGMLILNSNNNPVKFTIVITDTNGTTRQSPIQTLVARGTYVRVRSSLSALFSNFNVGSGFTRVQVTTLPGPGQGGRLIPFAVYRSNNATNNAVSVVSQQNAQP
jgi:hypothetical protein